MRIEDVPQDRGMIPEDGLREICYAVDSVGNYVLTPSAGWEPKNIANDQAWALIRENIRTTLRQIQAGKRSPLAYHMARNQMSVGLLAQYVGYNRLRVWYHLTPTGFRRLSQKLLGRYAAVFELDVATLVQVPEEAQVSRAL
jgi:hypothetical protein